jgi:hypothetical protein
MKSSSMKKTAETKHGCEFCKREFVRESTMLKHICEYKHRWLERDNRGNQIGFQSFVQFYQKHSASKKLKTYEEFIKSAYYTAFVKFGRYCLELNVVNVPRMVDYYLKENIKLDNWTSDTNYTKFLIDYLKTENPIDAVGRSMQYCDELAVSESIQPNDYLRYGNRNKICSAIYSGRISPWVLFHSESGVKMLGELTPDQVKMIFDYIDPDKWTIKFMKDKENVELVKQILDLAKW